MLVMFFIMNILYVIVFIFNILANEFIIKIMAVMYGELGRMSKRKYILIS